MTTLKTDPGNEVVDGRRHSTAGFIANVVVAKASYEMLEVLLIFRVKKKKKENEVSRGIYF